MQAISRWRVNSLTLTLARGARLDGILRAEVAMKRKNRKQRAGRGMSASTQKVSEMVWEFAGEFIRLGDTVEQKQIRVTAACSAWNMACNPPEVRNRSLDQYIKSYRSYNPEVTDEEISAILSDMERLIQNKLRLFPDVHKQIVGAQVTQVEGKDRIDVASASLE